MGKVLWERACWSQDLGSQRKLRGAGKLERFLRYVGVSPQIKKKKHYELDYIMPLRMFPGKILTALVCAKWHNFGFFLLLPSPNSLCLGLPWLLHRCLGAVAEFEGYSSK